MNKSSGYALHALVIVLGIVAGIGGWIANAYKLYHMCCDVSGLLLLRAIGVFIAPLGSVLGYF